MNDYSKPFIDWWNANEATIRNLYKTLSEPISNDPVEIGEQLRKSECLFVRAYALKADADAYLDVAIAQEWRGIEPDLPAKQKEGQVNAAVAPIRAVRDKLEGIVEALKSRNMSCLNLNREQFFVKPR